MNPSVAVSNLFFDPGPLLQIFIISNKNNVIDDLSVLVWITDISRKRLALNLFQPSCTGKIPYLNFEVSYNSINANDASVNNKQPHKPVTFKKSEFLK